MQKYESKISESQNKRVLSVQKFESFAPTNNKAAQSPGPASPVFPQKSPTRISPSPPRREQKMQRPIFKPELKNLPATLTRSDQNQASESSRRGRP